MTLFAVLLAGVAAVLWFPTPRRPWSRSPDLQLPAWLRPRDDALPGRLRWAVGAGAGMVAFLLADSLGVVAVLVAGGVGAGVAVGLGHVEPPSVQRQREQRIRDLPEVLDLLGACLAAGMPLRRAAREVAAVSQGPIGADLSLVVSLVDVGVVERQAWLSVADRPGWEGIGKDIARAAERGTGLRGALVGHAARARRNARAMRQTKARTLGVRSVWPLMLCFLPAFVCLGIVPTVGSMVLRILNFQ